MTKSLLTLSEIFGTALVELAVAAELHEYDVSMRTGKVYSAEFWDDVRTRINGVTRYMEKGNDDD